MAETIIKLRRDTEENYFPIASSFIPMYGEVCFVDTKLGLKYKVGDGVTTFSNLNYESANAEIISGYYFNEKFYSKSTYSAADLLPELLNVIYIDKNSNQLFHWDALQSKYISVVDGLPTATDAIAGIAKLYKTLGDNEDGSVTQKEITKELNDKITVDTINEKMIVSSFDVLM